jgi:cephalosporin hydroxylase
MVTAAVDERLVRRVALGAMIRRTNNFGNVTWLGRPIWQNPTDAWLLQQTIVDRKVDLVVECGTNRGGSAFFMASLFDLLGRGHVVTADIASLTEFSHPRITFITGSSTAPETAERIRAEIDQRKPEEVMVLLDSDHSAAHVRRECELYADLVPVGGYLVVQDGCIDELPRFRSHRPGPLVGLRQFLADDGRFEVDHERSSRYLVGQSPSGYLRRIR